MEGHSDGSAVAIVVILIIVLLFVVILGGGAGYMFLARQQAMVVAQAEMARAAEAHARMQAEEARDQLETARAKSTPAITKAELPETVPSAGEITGLLQAQRQAWNDGDLDRFMQTYWQSDELTFSAGGGTTRGWTATLQRYRDKYPDRAAMGALTLDGLEVTPLGDSAALVLGRWKIDRQAELVAGNFSLIVRQFDDGWKIVHDHTSQAAEASGVP